MGEYVTVNGVPTYYEVHGQGKPVVLLHGGGSGADGWWAQIPALAEHYRVYAPERQAHGRTPDREGPLTYAGMAEETAEFIHAIDIPAADIIGWSDGGVVALHLALRHPELVTKLVVISSYISNAGSTAATQELYREPNASQFLEFVRSGYNKLSPDGPEHFPVVAAKLLQMWRDEPGIDLAELAAIAVPTLLMQGDSDCVRYDHIAAMYGMLPDAQLAIVPGTSHTLPLEKPELVNRILLDFLADGQPQRLMPLGDKLAPSH